MIEGQKKKQSIGIQVVAPKKSIFGTLKEYEKQMVSNKGALVQRENGSGIIDTNSPPQNHGVTDALPIVLGGQIDGVGRTHALRMLPINQIQFSSEYLQTSFYRIFENKQKLRT